MRSSTAVGGRSVRGPLSSDHSLPRGSFVAAVFTMAGAAQRNSELMADVACEQLGRRAPCRNASFREPISLADRIMHFSDPKNYTFPAGGRGARQDSLVPLRASRHFFRISKSSEFDNPRGGLLPYCRPTEFLDPKKFARRALSPLPKVTNL